MDKEFINIQIADLLDQIERIDRIIHIHRQNKNEAVSLSMIRQYSVGREEFVEQLNDIFKRFSLNVTSFEKIPVSQKRYSNEPLSLNLAHEPTIVYGEKDNLNAPSKIDG